MSVLFRGSINVDEFFDVPRIVPAGETIAATGYRRRLGGKGANSAIACARAGAAVHLAGWVGEDGRWLLKVLGRDLALEFVHVDPELPTGRALIQVDAAGNNSIVILHGANGSTTPVPDLRIVLPLPDSHGYTHVVLQNEVPLSVTTSTLRDARAAGIVTLFNPSPLLSTSAAAAFDWTLVDYLVINEHEAQALLVGYEAGGVICRDHISGSRATGACATIVTHGAAGYTLCIDEDISSYPAPKAHAVDSTGAGDCFLGYLAAGLARCGRREASREELLAALEVACAAASMSVERMGATDAVPRLGDVTARISGAIYS